MPNSSEIEQLKQLLYEKECYIQALEKQIELYQNELSYFRMKFSINKRITSEGDVDLNSSQEQVISKSKINQFQNSDNKFKLKEPLSTNNGLASTRQSQYVKQKVIKDSIDINNLTINEFNCLDQDARLFDDLFLIGIDQQDFSNSQFNPRILFQFNKQCREQNQEFIRFLFPNELCIKDIPFTDLTEITTIINQYYSINSKNCFVISIKQIDQQIMLYYICILFDDFTVISNEQVKKHQKVICFSTKYYLIDFYLTILIGFLQSIQSLRQQQLKIYKNWSAIDSKIFQSNFREIVITHLIKLNQTTIKNMTFHFNQHILEIKEEYNIKWGRDELENLFSSEILVKLFVSLLVEKSIVFISKSSQLLSLCIILCQKYLIRPFNWIHPIITILPKEHLSLLGSPVPLIIGLNMNMAEVQNQKLIEKFNDLVFLDLDGSPLTFYNYQNIPLISVDLMNFLTQKLNVIQGYQKLMCFEYLLRVRVLQNLPNNPYQVLQQLSTPNKNQKQRIMLDYQRIGEKVIEHIQSLGNSDRFLWKQFFKTQIFAQYVDQFYNSYLQ